jgi:F-type H+-transporting ATPase subunit alpha
MGFEEQVVSIYSGVKGYLDKITSKEVTKFEAELMRKIKASKPEILASIKKEQKITDETETNLKKIIEEFVATFINHSPSNHVDHVGLNDRLKHESK